MYQQHASRISHSCSADAGRPRMTGVTLLELLIVIVIASILMAIAMPSYKYITTSYRISGEINGLLGDVQFARAEAVKEGQNVTLCVVNGMGNDCATGAVTAWQNGWIVFSDPTSGKTTGGNAALILRQQAAFSSSDTLSSSIGSMIFNREGLVTGLLSSGGATLTLHDPTATVAWTRCLQVSNVGAAFVVQNTTPGASCT
jgi:type IV fimbrial biogenesis protein FimT